MDGGIDDALALVLGLRSPEIEVIGITSVSGNVPVRQATVNALRVVELVGRPEVWVAKGAARPLARDPIRAYEFHGRDGLGDSHLPMPQQDPFSKTALKAMNETLSSAKRREVTIICTGPLTNLASLLTHFPESKNRIEEIIVMGGAYGITQYGVGNETPVAEFNIYSDPEAAKLVFGAKVPLKTVGLDVTTIPQLELERSDYARIRKEKGKFAAFAARTLKKNMRLHGRFTLHDPMAVASAIWPALYEFSSYRVCVESRGEYTTGMTIADRRSWLSEDKLSGDPVMVCSHVGARFKRLFLERVTAA
jgi:purine nucleosidase